MIVRKFVFLGSHFSSSYFGQGTVPIVMDYVNCSGSEFRLYDCNHFTHSYGCTHIDDVGVRCQPGLSATTHAVCSYIIISSFLGLLRPRNETKTSSRSLMALTVSDN